MAHQNRVRLTRKVWQRGFALFSSVAGALGLGQQAQAELVETNVRSFTQLSDGSLQVTFSNGRSIIVPQGDYSIIDGRIFIENGSISLAGVGTSGVAATNGAGIFGGNIPTWLWVGGAAVGGYFLASGAGEGDEGDDESATADSALTASGSTLTGSITNIGNAAGDDAPGVVIADLSALFADAEGSLIYTIDVEDSSGASANSLMYVNGAAIQILQDPEVPANGVYTVSVTATDTANGDKATATAFVTIEVESEAITNSAIGQTTMDENDAASTVVVADLDAYFLDSEDPGGFDFDVEVKDSAGASLSGILRISGSSLTLAQDVTDTLVEQLNVSSGGVASEVISLTVTVTATDPSDGTELVQTFSLILDASGYNDAPELGSPSASTQILNENATGSQLMDGETVELDLSSFVTDEENDTLLWNLDTTGLTGTYTIDQSTGIITGTADVADDDLRMTVTVDDLLSADGPVSISVYLDIA